ncbi:MAG: helix-turn-helix transcriptional regulator [Planctomycetales bacterium]|nr:helix-turn-helix transcriptional regulator [Planctomycetales bacterium]
MSRNDQAAWRLEYVDACYSAALGDDPQALNLVLKMLVERIGAAMSFLQIMSTTDTSMQGIAAWGVPDEVLQDYAINFSAEDPWLDLFKTRRLRWGQVANTGRHEDRGEVDMAPLTMTPYFNEFWRRWGLLHTAGTFTEIAPGRILSLGTPRYKDAGSLPLRLREDFSFASHHIVRVVSIQERISGMRLDGERRQSVLDKLCFGALLINSSGRITLSNERAQDLMKPSGPLKSHGGFLQFRDEALDQRLRDQLGLSTIAAPRRNLQAPESFAVHSADGRRWVVFIFPWTSTNSDHWAILFLDDDPEEPKAEIEAAISLLGDLTNAEQEVMRLMLQGLGSSEIAQMRKTSNETVRSQVKSVLHKLGVRRQTDLQRLAARYRLPFKGEEQE